MSLFFRGSGLIVIGLFAVCGCRPSWDEAVAPAKRSRDSARPVGSHAGRDRFRGHPAVGMAWPGEMSFPLALAAAGTTIGDDEEQKPSFDAAENNGPIFEGWPDPQVAIVFSGLLQGYLEPCGCAGLENQKGGLSRRYTFLEERRKAGWPVVAVDLGSFVRRKGKQAEIKLMRAIESYIQMDYDVMTFGREDLDVDVGELFAGITNTPGATERFVASNVGLFGLKGSPFARYRVMERGGRKIGVTAVFGDAYGKAIGSSDVEIKPSAAALAEIAPKLRAECDYCILLVQATRQESIDLAAKFPQFDVVLISDGAAEPPAQPLRFKESRGPLFIEIGQKGMYLGVLGLYDDPQVPWRYQRVPMDARFKDAAPMHAMMVDYQKQLEDVGFEGLGISPKVHPRGQGQADPRLGQFVGPTSCKKCHESEHDVWTSTPHSHATETLVNLDPPRHFDPECLSCHATGWSPQEYFPYESGYLALDSTPEMLGNSCENCHGPGAAHVAAENGNDRRLQLLGRQSMRVSLETAEQNVCLLCHDLDNSPAFNVEGAFEDEYWPQVEH
jgi:hypothetical protein